MEEESPATMAEPQPAVPPSMEDEDERESNEEDEAMVEKAQALMDMITASPDNPNPHALHALASILESQESSYMEEADHSSINGRAAHNIGRLGNLLRDNDEFFELLSAKFLFDTRYPISVQAAALRLLYSCSLTWMYPHVFEETVVENIKAWVIADTAKSSTEDQNWMHELGLRQSSDLEMLRTYSTGLFAACLAGEGQLVEDVLTSGLPAKLIRYLRIRALGETSTSKKEANYLVESESAPAADSTRSREEGQSRFRQILETHHLDPPRTVEQGSLDDAENNQNRNWLLCSDEQWADDGEPPDGLGEDIISYEANVAGEERWHGREVVDRKAKFGDRPVREEHFDESVRDDSSRRRVNRECARSRWKTRVNESAMDWNTKDRNLVRNLDKRIHDAKKSLGSVADGLERDHNDDCFQEFKIGSKDISDLVKKAVRAAEAEARTVNAPTETIKAVGDVAAEVVKNAALEVFKITNDEEAAILAASRAASAVIDAGTAVEALRSSSGVAVDDELMNSGPTELQSDEEAEEFFILDSDSLAKLREKFCIQCLGILGKYNVVCGQMLHEKGVDICLALLQRSSTHTEAPKIALLLPDVLKLICALSGHQFFFTLFVDRGGIQKLLAVPRISSTFVGLSSCLYAIGSVQGLECVCALPSNVINQVIALALQLLECSQDQARKNAALFFAAAFVFRAVVDSFDALDGLQKLLNPLRYAANVRSGSLRNNQSQVVLTSSEKQIAYHTTIALHQYFRAHLILLVDSVRPGKTNRSVARNVPSLRAEHKPLDIRNEAMDAVFRQIQKDRKLGPAFVRACWPAVDKFLSSNGHITMLELCQAPPVERYLHELGQHALGVLYIVTMVPHGRKLVVNATVSNDRLGIAVVLDAANGAGYVDPEIIKSALNVLVNLVCPPPSLSNKPTLNGQGQSSSVHTSNAPAMDRERISERNIMEQGVHLVSQNDPRERNGESGLAFSVSSASQTPSSAVTSGLVGDCRISLGARASCAGLAAQLEQGYHQARDAVRANNGIKVLLQLLRPRIIMPSPDLDCLRALACRVLLGLARDDAIAHILTKLQVGKKLSDLIRDSGNQVPSGEQGRWQAELAQVAIELISIVTNSGRASTLAATDAAIPTLRRIERAAIAAATPITYHSRELLLLMHEHLQASGLATTAATLLNEAQLTPLPSLAAPSSLEHQTSGQEPLSVQIQWPSGRTACGFSLSDKCKKREDSILKHGFKKKALVFSSSKVQPQSYDLGSPSVSKLNSTMKKSSPLSVLPETPSTAAIEPLVDADSKHKTPIVLAMKRKLTDLRDLDSLPLGKRLNTSEHVRFKDNHVRFLASGGPIDSSDENQSMVQANDLQSSSSERLTLDSIVLHYLKHQHRQCPAPITTLPPLSLLHPHVCPESKRSLDTPNNITARISTHEFRSRYKGIHGSRMNRQFVYSRFRPWRICRDNTGVLFTCLSFLGDSSQIAAGTDTGELKIFDPSSSNFLESSGGHNYPLTIVQSYISGDSQLILSSSARDVRLWDAPSVSGGPKYSFEGCKAARFSHCGTMFAAISSEIYRREVLLYDVQTCKSDLKMTDTSTSSSSKGSTNSLVHFSPSDIMLLWNGALWDRRVPGPVHRFDQFSDYGGGGFHPARNEVIINNEVWDLRNFKLVQTVPCLEQTSITFNASGDVIYAIMRRNTEDVTSALRAHHLKHPLFAAFRTVDAINYTEIATTPVDRCVIDFATDPTDSFVGLVTIDDQEEMYSSARVYEIGRRKPTDDDPDPDDADESEEEEEDDDDDDDGDGDDVDVNDVLLGDDDDDMSDNEDRLGGDDGGDGMFETEDDSEFEESVSSGDEEEYLA